MATNSHSTVAPSRVASVVEVDSGTVRTRIAGENSAPEDATVLPVGSMMADLPLVAT